MSSRLPYLHDLAPEEIDDLIMDLSLRGEGAKIYFAVDPHEIFDFCYPVNPTDTYSLSIDAIADAQAALYEVFFARQEKPLLLPEYVGEVRALFSYLTQDVDNVYSAAEMLEGIIDAGNLSGITEAEKAGALESFLQSSFNIVLAISMGIYSLGTERFRSIFQNRLLTDKPEADTPQDEQTIKEVYEEYSGPILIDQLFNNFRKRPEGQISSGVERERKLRADYVDACAIDRLLYLNRALEEAYQKKKLSHRYIVLYLSSAAKSKRFFDTESIKNVLPMIGGSHFPILRTRQQVFAYVINKSHNADPALQFIETIKNLQNLKDMLITMQRVGSINLSDDIDCQLCILEGGNPPSCERIEFCKTLQTLNKEILKKRMQIENLGLVKTLNDYQQLLTARPSSASHKVYLDFFSTVFQSNVKDLAMAKMYEKQHLITLQLKTVNMFKEGFSVKKSDEGTSLFRSKKDSVVDINQYLPSKPILNNPKYKEILDSILCYFKTPSEFALVEEAYKQFIALGTDSEALDAEHELIKCYLYLTFPMHGGEEKAYQHCKELLDIQELMERKPLIEREYRYMLCWLARRTRNFGEADACASIGIEKWSDDARFYHGRALNIFAWLELTDPMLPCPYTINDAIEATEKAIELYSRNKNDNLETLAGNYNNIAYLYSLDVARNNYSLSESSEKLIQARDAIAGLKSLISRDSWQPEHPEYFHTEAYLAYQEFLIEFASGMNKADLKQKLAQAKSDIARAIQLYGKASYIDLQRSIQDAMERVTHSL
jgi:hypothetical protein